MQTLLSVIVPCYNVEKYIDRCVSSIVAQTYPNLEILLVDDGSTDQTGALCGEWQKKDSRIRVIHRQNEGSSYARKTGVENATAEYVTFVDADDWIDENMYLNMINALLSTQSDIAQCGFYDVYEDDKMQSEPQNGSFVTVDRTNGVVSIIEDEEWKSYFWNKIFKKHLFDRIEFPELGLNEDAAMMHILFHRAAQTVYLQDKYYFYFRRTGSITAPNTLVSKMKNCYDTYRSFYERYYFVDQHPEYHTCLLHAVNNVISRGIRTLRNSMIYPQFFPEYCSDTVYKQLQAIPFSRKDLNKKFFSLLMRVEISVFLKSPACYKMLVMLVAKMMQFLRLNKLKLQI